MNTQGCWYKGVCSDYVPNSCENGCIRYAEMRYLIDASGIPEFRQYNLTLEAGEDYEAFCELANIKDNIAEFVHAGKNLYIMSRETGNGKTTWAIKLMLRYFDQIWAGNGFQVKGMFIHTPALLTQLKDFNNPVSKEFLTNLDYCDLVIFDDIGSTELSNYDHSQLLTHIDFRVCNGKSCIFTGNIVKKDTLSAILGTRLASRIWNSTNKVIELIGKDRR